MGYRQIIWRRYAPHLMELTTGGVQAYAMEEIRGRSLRQIAILQDEADLASLAPTVLVMVSVAIDDCYGRKGIRHRDINLGNIIIEEETNRPFIVDWGISTPVVRATELNISYDGSYMPPEIGQIDEESIGTDTYELAYMMYEMISASSPYGNVTVPDKYGNERHFPIPRLWEDGGLVETPYESLKGKNLQIELSDGQISRLDTIFKRALSIKTEERYQSAVEFALEVARVIGETEQEWQICCLQLEDEKQKSLAHEK